MNRKTLPASLGVFLALNKRTDAPAFSAQYWHAHTLLMNELNRLNALLVKYKVATKPLDFSEAIRYAVQQVRVCHSV